mmetsp:Transcript_33173/g.109656  ORF Transcript_33173/g.109656 Transcript_33173/m.109656 type:complete len:446 (-) Transcript_33173:295-1632(-)
MLYRTLFAGAALINAVGAWTPPKEVEEAAKASHWAVLIAGSSGYGNYRHQADVCHAYQIMIKNGIDPDKIITLAVDDVANDDMNPFPGKLFNKPTADGTPGTDVYAGCKIDYSGAMVTPETFVKVLTGDAAGLDGGKVLQSTKLDRVFVNFVDHGGVNIIGFPRTTMHARDLVAALKKMHSAGMYKELVFYLEACESGSMFTELPEDISVYATTAANAHESSWGTYCMPEDKVEGKHIGSCLGDLYSVTWMEDTDNQSPAAASETIETQTERVTRLVTKSHVQVFGDTTISSELITNFEGDTDSAGQLDTSLAPMIARAAPQRDAAIRSNEAALASAYFRFTEMGSAAAGEELVALVQARLSTRKTFEAVAQRLGLNGGIEALPPRAHGAQHVDCHYDVHKAYKSACGELHPEALSFSATMADLCAHQGGSPDAIVKAISAVCAA